MEEKSKEYLLGYRHGFMAALTLTWALAEQLLINVPNGSKEHVQDFIDKLKA